MARQEIEQRPEERLLIMCHCGGHFHYVCFDIEWDSEPYDAEDEPLLHGAGYKHLWITLTDEGHTLWDRIKAAIRYVIGCKAMYYGAVGITMKDIESIREMFDKYERL